MYGHEISNFLIVQLKSISNYITYTVVPRDRNPPLCKPPPPYFCP